MLKYTSILFLLTISPIICSGQNWQNIPYEHLSFQTPDQEEWFKAPEINTNQDWISALLIADRQPLTMLESIEKELNTIIAALDKKKIHKKKLSQQVEMIQKYCYHSYLNAFDGEATWKDFLRSKTTSHFVSLQMFGYLFDHYDIPYEIQKTYYGFRIALLGELSGTKTYEKCFFPGITAPPFTQEGYQIDLDFLVKFEHIQAEDFEGKTSYQAWKEITGAKAVISKKEMIASRYIVNAVNGSQKTQLQKAELAYHLYPFLGTKLLLLNYYTQSVEMEEVSHPARLMSVYKACQLWEFPRVDSIYIQGQYQVLRNWAPSITTSLEYEDFKKEMEAYRAIVKEDTFKYQNKKAIENFWGVHYLEGNVDRAIKALVRQDLLKDVHYADEILANDLSIALLFEPLLIVEGMSERVDLAIFEDSIAQYTANYPEMIATRAYQENLTCFYFQVAGDYFQLDRSAALKYLDLAKATQQKHQVTGITLFITYAYESAWGYYIRKGSMSRAKQMLEEGIAIAPDTYELQRKLGAYH